MTQGVINLTINNNYYIIYSCNCTILRNIQIIDKLLCTVIWFGNFTILSLM